MASPVLCEVIEEPIKRLAELIGEPIKVTGERALRKALASRFAPVSALVCWHRFSPVGGAPAESPYTRSPVGFDAGMLGTPVASPKRAPRKVPRSPFKVRAGPRQCSL